MRNLLKAEYYRTFHRMLFLVTIGFLFYCAISNGFLLFATDQGVYVEESQELLTDLYKGQPEVLAQKMRELWQLIYAKINTYFLRVPVHFILALTFFFDLKKRRIAEMVMAGHSRVKIFCTKTIVYLTVICLPHFCASINFWTHPTTYADYVYREDIWFLIRIPCITLLFSLCLAAIILPGMYLLDKPLFGILGIAVYALCFWERSSFFSAYSYASLLDQTQSGRVMVSLAIYFALAVICIAASWLIFRRKNLKT